MAKQYSYLPAVHERPYYGALFQAADDERIGSIGGTKAVAFFTRSKLPITILKDIWTLSDQPPTNALDPMKFAVAIRLIQCEQNGIHLPTIVSNDLTQGLPPNLRPAYFDGIPPPPSPPLPPPQGAPPATAAGMVSGPPAQPQPPPPRPPSMVPHHDNVSVAGSASVGGGGHNHQLAVQDPYMITPSEQVRYEQLFPDYVQQDPTGTYMTGGEAVALFNKSGLSQAILSQIWNMVDTNPVDNQLDKIEFVLAMHLIVCISKKNLPVPPSLPLSLKNLKAQQQQPHPQSNNINSNPVPQTIYQPQHQPNPSMPPTMNSSNMSMGGSHPPSTPDRSQFQHPPVSAMPSPPMGAMHHSVPPPQMMASNAMPPSIPTSAMDGPPPLSQPGGVSISDAFEGLDGIGGGMGDMTKNPVATGFNYGAGGDTGSISSYHASTPEVSARHHLTFEQKTEVVVETIPEPAPEQYSNQHLETTTNHQSGNTNKDYVTSYKMGDSNAELQKLKDALQKLQAENISLKASMGSLSLEEQDTQKELNATISEVTKLSNDLTKTRAQVLASKSRLLQAAAELKAAKEKTSVLKDLISDATVTKQAIDEAHESIENASEVLARSAGATSTFQSAPAPAIAEEDLFGGWGTDDGGAVNAPLPALGSGNFSSAAASSVDESQPSTYNYNNPPQVQIETPQPALSSPMPSYSYNPNPEPVPPTVSTNMYNGGGYTGGGGGMGGHNRDMSGNDFGEVMGSSPSLQPPLPTIQQYDSGFGSSMGANTYDSIPHVTSIKEVEDLRAKSKEADDVAKEAEASRRQLVAQLDELRKLADEAESKVRAASEKPTKKKGILGRGGATQKKDAKEIERLTMDARDKKDALLLAQSQVKDAESLAVATKREAERLNKEAEDAQMSAASAASMQEHGNNQNQMTVSSQQSPRYDLAGTGGMMPMQVYDNPGSTGIDYSNPFG